MEYNEILEPADAIRAALTQKGPEGPAIPYAARSVAVLERNAPRVVQQALRANVTIEYLGVHPIFDQTRVFAGPESDWTFGPIIHERSRQIMPRAQLRDLERLAGSGVYFPLLYEAHEFEVGKIPSTALATTTMNSALATSLIEPVPLPQVTIDLSDRLSERSHQIVSALGKAVPIIGAVIAAPFLLVGAAALAVGGLAISSLDPIIIGAIPAGRPVPGTPATWFVLARWEW
jgi:hypothetical protein